MRTLRKHMHHPRKERTEDERGSSMPFNEGQKLYRSPRGNITPQLQFQISTTHADYCSKEDDSLFTRAGDQLNRDFPLLFLDNPDR